MYKTIQKYNKDKLNILEKITANIVDAAGKIITIIIILSFSVKCYGHIQERGLKNIAIDLWEGCENNSINTSNLSTQK
jgi:hypothetical protein